MSSRIETLTTKALPKRRLPTPEELVEAIENPDDYPELVEYLRLRPEYLRYVEICKELEANSNGT